ncbi:alpha/beta fold hydrolase [Legionella sainthelensi]|uniref:alpha/beta fold hydrolase n=1 Tax=Legionella sainthelensi TaxID=28087 RepID=UPI0021668253|nr:hypothetical protein [Legionella sainthelensi]
MKRSYLIFLLCLCFFNNTLLASTMKLSNADQFISYTEVGQGKPLVLIHAFPTDQRLWQPQLEGLKNIFMLLL